MIKLKETAREIASQSWEDWWAMGEAFRLRALETLRRKVKPDEVVVREGLSRVFLVARKKFPEPMEDSWGVFDEYWDEVLVSAKSDKEELPAPEEIKEREFSFRVFTGKEQEELLEALSQYILVDYIDRCAPVVEATCVRGLYDTSPSEEWNEKARMLCAKDRRGTAKSIEEMVEECFP